MFMFPCMPLHPFSWSCIEKRSMGSSISGVTLGSGSGVLVEDGLCGKH